MHVQKGPVLTSNTCEELIQHACSEGHALTSDLVRTKSYTLARMAPGTRLSYLVMDHVPALSQSGSLPYICHTQQKGQHSHLTWEEPNPLAMIEWFSPYI